MSTTNHHQHYDAYGNNQADYTPPQSQLPEQHAQLPPFFIVRPGTTRHTASGAVITVPGPIVPLIPMDQLPEWIDVVGVPRDLAVEQTVGLQNLGNVYREPEYYDVRLLVGPEDDYDSGVVIANGSTDRSFANDEGMKGSDGASEHQHRQQNASRTRRGMNPAAEPFNTTPSTPPPNRESFIVTSSTGTRLADRRVSNHLAPAAELPQNGYSSHSHLATRFLNSFTSASSHPSSTTNNTLTKQEPSSTSIYCRHWCHHGTCKWGADCRYEHAMPHTAEGLREVGLADFPTWWIAGAMRMAFGMGGMEGPWYGGLGAGGRRMREVRAMMLGSHSGLGGGKGKGKGTKDKGNGGKMNGFQKVVVDRPKRPIDSESESTSSAGRMDAEEQTLDEKLRIDPRPLDQQQKELVKEPMEQAVKPGVLRQQKREKLVDI